MKIKILRTAAVLAATSIFIHPFKCEASIVYGAYASIVILSQPSTCEASITDQLCSAITNFLDGEAAKADTAAKGCKDKCPLTQKKRDVIGAAQKKVNSSCAKGLTPDIAEVGKGLDKNAQEKLGKLYNLNSRMFDGAADRPDKDFNVTSNPTPALTGKGGQVADLKAADPVLDKIASATEFGIKPLKSAAAADSSCRAYTIPSCAELPLFMQDADQDIASAKAAVAAWEGASDSREKQLRLAEWRAWLKCLEDEKAAVVAATAGCGKCSASQDLVNGNCVPKCSGGQTRNAAGTCECSAGKELVNGNCVPSGGGNGGTVQPPAKKSGWDKLKEWGKNYLEDVKTVANWTGNWIKEKTLEGALAVSTSDITKITPTANMLLRHAKDGKGDLNDKTYPAEASYLREKIKDTSEYKDARNEVFANMKKNPSLTYTKATGEYRLFKNPDLYFAIKQFDVIGRKVNGKIQITLHDRYDFDAGDNPGILGRWWQDNGLIKPYPIDIVMQ